MAKTKPTPTPASEWRRPREQGYTVILRTGKVVTLRPVALDRLLAAGKVPNLLLPVVTAILWSQVGVHDRMTPEEIAAEEDKYRLELINLVVPAALVYPRLVDNPQADDEIGIDDLPFGDKLAIYTLAKLPAEVLGNFCEKQDRDVEPVQASEVIQPETE